MCIRAAFVALCVGAVSLMGAPVVRADAPGLSDYVWNVPNLGFSDCMQRAAKALQELGIHDLRQKTVESGVGFVGGVLGDYYVEVMCLTSKAAVVTLVTGDDYNIADKYRQQVDASMGNGSGH
jgi:hypothetical protein